MSMAPKWLWVMFLWGCQTADQSERLQAGLSRYAISNYRGAKKFNNAWEATKRLGTKMVKRTIQNAPLIDAPTPSPTNICRNRKFYATPAAHPLLAPHKDQNADEMHCRNLEALELGVMLSSRQHAIKPFPTSDSLRVVGILDLDPGKRVRAGLGLADDSL
jgi:hypothetical protein